MAHALLLVTALGFPTLARRPRAWRDDDYPPAKREEWEARAQALAWEKARHVRMPLEDEAGLLNQVQESVKALQQRLFDATCKAQLAALLEQRFQQVQAGGIDEASTLDALSVQVLAANDRLIAAKEEERVLLDECARLVELNKTALSTQKDNAELQVSAEEAALLREQSALLGVFRTLIIQSKVDWAKDAALKEVMLTQS